MEFDGVKLNDTLRRLQLGLISHWPGHIPHLIDQRFSLLCVLLLQLAMAQHRRASHLPGPTAAVASALARWTPERPQPAITAVFPCLVHSRAANVVSDGAATAAARSAKGVNLFEAITNGVARKHA